MQFCECFSEDRYRACFTEYVVTTETYLNIIFQQQHIYSTLITLGAWSLVLVNVYLDFVIKTVKVNASTKYQQLFPVRLSEAA